MKLLLFVFYFQLDTFNVLAGIGPDGEGYVYSYDAIGSYEEKRHGATGSGSVLATPLLDNFMDKQHQTKVDKTKKLTKDEAINLVRDVLNGVVERDIQTGDSADIYVITEKGCEYQKLQLRKD